MIALTINGERRSFEDSLTVAQLIEQLQLAGKRIALERNGEIVPRGQFGTQQLIDGDRLEIVTVALESDAGDVQKAIGKLPVRSVMGTPELARAFGDISAVPTLFVFDRKGNTAGVFYGAPPTLHAEAERTITTALR